MKFKIINERVDSETGIPEEGPSHFYKTYTLISEDTFKFPVNITYPTMEEVFDSLPRSIERVLNETEEFYLGRIIIRLGIGLDFLNRNKRLSSKDFDSMIRWIVDGKEMSVMIEEEKLCSLKVNTRNLKRKPIVLDLKNLTGDLVRNINKTTFLICLALNEIGEL